ncbi:S1C family serine protease [Staphylococcus epidermidis]|uniref:S1C family serine protease n=1 Tax=Staphylococcus epidermidis TaxID=1282 RepID=UPI00026C0D36|nr:S1C family serine protease [Staphylococcus epidermidis]EJD81263.1 putative serine protease HtrA-like protein [Staphylococcus epidermidis NIHLM095]EJD84244.1 putative serine protease HtrA-like protein [Staphylococcus epidermidis NIHLM087]KAB2282851.1 PDZ domain-containing protein [Staphylococcus epidermidis]MCT1658431.1 S1C family serine protease [Staphylococcus epidermidis]MDH9340070.1 S1C family serine protease [Staphylococcus epidermidis]
MDNNKKQVIPRSQYRRKRREYFHNEEREERIRREKIEKENQAKREQHQTKVNEERVKDNLRKARIEKLTQEEIHQQRDDKSYKQKTLNQNNQMNKSKDDDNKIGEESLHDVRVLSDTSTLPHQSKSKQLNDNQSNENQYHNKVIESSENKSIKDYDDDSGNESKQHTKLTSKKSMLGVNSNHTEQDSRSTQPYSSKHSYSQPEDKDNDNTQQAQFLKKEDKQRNRAENIKKVNEFKQLVIAFFKEHWPKMLIIIGIIVLLLILNAIFTTVNKNDHTNDSAFNGTAKDETTAMKIAENSVKSVVTVENDLSNDTTVSDNKNESDNEIGSGVVYKKVGDSIYIFTNAHVVGDQEKQKVTFGNDKSVTGKVIGKDKWSDLAVVKAKVADENIKPMTMGDSNNIKLAEPILVIGNPLGTDFKGSVSQGIVSGLNRHVPVDIDKNDNYDALMKAFQIDAPVNPGNSGGAVVDRDGRLIGIVSLKIDMHNVEGMAFAIPINDVRKIAKELEHKGKVNYPNTEIKIKNVGDLDDSERNAINLPAKVNHGVLIGEVKENGLGDKAGLKKGDVIVELDGKKIEDNLRYRQVIFSHYDDQKTITAKIYRNGAEKNIKIKLK